MTSQTKIKYYWSKEQNGANLLRAEGFYIESEVWYFYQNILNGKWWLQLKLGAAREPKQ